MLIQKLENTTITNAQSTSFSVQSSGKMFKILMAGLYSNKPESITREIWSNAYDAHKMVGKESVPFEVVFPNTFREEFVVRDFGPGISHDDMQKLYTVLGYSSKEESNDAVGKWGVGRMSPMAYTDTFTVTSWHKGLKATYNVIFDGMGEPTLQTLVAPAPTDEPSGLRVSFPVSRRDVGTFQQAAKRVAIGFDVKPVVTGVPDFDWDSLKITFQGNGYDWYKPDYYKLTGAYAKMGCVLYPIDHNQIKDASVSDFLRNSHIIIHFPIGDLEVTASRESLSYGANDPTTANIEKQVKSILEGMCKEAQDKIDACESSWEAYCEAINSFGVTSSSLSKILRDNLKINGKTVENKFFLGEWVSLNHLTHRKTLSSQSVNYLTNAHTNKITKITYVSSKVTRVKDRLREVCKSNNYVIYCESKENLEVARKLFPANLFLDLATVTPPAYNKKPKGQVQVRDIHNKIITINFEDGGVYIPWTGGRADYTFDPILLALNASGLGKDKQVVMVPKTLQERFIKSSAWVELKPLVKEWVEKNRSTLVACAETPVTPPFASVYTSIKGKGMALVQALAASQSNDCLGLNQGAVANLLYAYGFPFKDGVATGSELAKEAVRKVKEYYPLWDNLYYTPNSLQTYVSLVDDLDTLKEENAALKEQVFSLMS